MQIEILTVAGFTPCANPSIGTSSLIKQLKAWDMPYVREHIVGTMGLTDSDLVCEKFRFMVQVKSRSNSFDPKI